ncbi:hypothetical protein DXT89_08610 [Agrobacterium vitis]|uniref:Uncharacterized protein n=1 Tax=Agrobacterium vitis TaxID=373 RepID=A0A368NPH1_AGRVI|nr:hypothetical protein DXM22_11085 [Agrobacterium vitis]KAA3529754.1 hypothetical protein DXT89_08610 [Agrobacterium vitis]RCU52308.1 hypothetical protein ASB66_019445 [Agrobacterium vitis]
MATTILSLNFVRRKSRTKLGKSLKVAVLWETRPYVQHLSICSSKSTIKRYLVGGVRQPFHIWLPTMSAYRSISTTVSAASDSICFAKAVLDTHMLGGNGNTPTRGKPNGA